MEKVDYVDTFLAVAGDCAATSGTVPPSTAEKRSVAARTFELIGEHPYRYTSGEVLFTVFADRPRTARAASLWSASTPPSTPSSSPDSEPVPRANRSRWSRPCGAAAVPAEVTWRAALDRRRVANHRASRPSLSEQCHSRHRKARPVRGERGP